MQSARFLSLGRVDYGEAHRLQQALVRARQEGRIGDVVLFLEHPPTLTLGRAGSEANILASPRELAARGVEVHRIERGGDVTYHGPGQLVGYPILDLGGYGRDLHLYVRNLEEVLIRSLRAYGLDGRRRPGYPGVWVEGRKIAALGVAVRRWVTMHGFALNVCCDLSHFDAIVPCGIDGCAVTSLCRALGREVTVEAVAAEVRDEFAAVFGLTLQPVEREDLERWVS